MVKYRFFKGFSIVLLIGALSLVSTGQSLDSLYREVKRTNNQERKANLLNELAWQNLFSAPDTSLKYARLALEIAQKNQLKKEESYGLNGIANYYLIYTGNLDSAEHFFEKALQIRMALNDSLMIGRSLNSIANVQKKRGRYLKAIESYLSAINYLTAKKGITEKAKVWMSLGAIYQSLGLYEVAFEALSQSSELLDQSENQKVRADLQLTFGNYYEEIASYITARTYFHRALSIYRAINNRSGVALSMNNVGNTFFKEAVPDSAIVYYGQALDQFRQLGQKDDIAGVLTNIGQVYALQKKHEVAIYYLKQGLEERRILKNPKSLAESMLNLGLVYLQLDDRQDSAIHFLKEGHRITQEKGLRNLELKVLKARADLAAFRGSENLQLQFLERYSSLNDSLQSNYRKAINLQFDLEQEKRGKLEERLRYEQLMAQHQRQRNFLWAAVIIFLLLIGLALALIIIFRQKKRKAELERDRKKQELDSVRSILEVQDSERKRIARDLHDRLGSMLSFTKMTFQRAEAKIDQLKDENRTSYREACEKLDEAVDLIREIAQDLDSGVLNKFGLIPAIQELLNSVERSSDLNIDFEPVGMNQRLERPIEETIYHVVQELMNNVLKHAKATEVTLQFVRYNGNLNVILEDNGVGFDLSKIEEKNGMGIKNIQSRLQPLNGTIEIDTVKGRGTIINIDFPLEGGSNI